MTKSPAFQFYPDDFVGSTVGMMTIEEVGIYTLLLCLDWNQNGFVFDQKKLARWWRTSQKKFAKAWETVGENFTETDGRMYNPRLQIEREKQAENRKKKQDAAHSRWNAGAYAGAEQTECPPSPSPIPSPSPLQTETVHDAVEHAARTPNGNGASVSLVPTNPPALARRLVGTLAPVVEKARQRTSREGARALMAEYVFAYWMATTGHPNAKYDRDKPRSRGRMLERALMENGDDLSLCFYAVDGSQRSEWHKGKYDDIPTIFRDQAQIEKMANLCPKARMGEPHPRVADFFGQLGEAGEVA